MALAATSLVFRARIAGGPGAPLTMSAMDCRDRRFRVVLCQIAWGRHLERSHRAVVGRSAANLRRSTPAVRLSIQIPHHLAKNTFNEGHRRMSTRLRSTISTTLGFAAALLAVSPVSAADSANEAHAVPFVEVATSALPDRDWARKVCQLAATSCGASSQQNGAGKVPSLYRAKGDASSNYYAILPGPQLLKMSLVSGIGWIILQKWDFSDYQPKDRETGDGEAPPLEIYPALYPLGSDRLAVAVLAGWSESYSGGGGGWEVADFVELSPNGGHVGAARVAKLPFSCNKSIRACFSEHDYQHSPHCSEDFDGSLRLRFVTGASAGKLDWIATWKETHWPGLEPKSKIEHTSVSVTLPAGQDPAVAGDSLRGKVPFCEPIN